MYAIYEDDLSLCPQQRQSEYFKSIWTEKGGRHEMSL